MNHATIIVSILGSRQNPINVNEQTMATQIREKQRTKEMIDA